MFNSTLITQNGDQILLPPRVVITLFYRTLLPLLSYLFHIKKTRWSIGCAEVLRVEKCSQAACWQRAGRAGRVGPGSCYRLYSEAGLRARPAHTSPPILRSPLAPTVLHLLTLGADPLTFDLIDKPPVEAVQEALRLLMQLGNYWNTSDP